MKIEQIKTGDIFLVHSTSTLARIIQKFQMRNDKEAGYWNHSGILYKSQHGDIYIIEEAEIIGYKLRASVVFTPIEKYLKSDKTLMVCSRTQEWKGQDAADFEHVLFKYVGIPYDYGNLLVHQIVRLLKGKWIGRKKAKAWKKMVCHEFTMTVWDEFAGIFPERHMARVSDIYRSPHFQHMELKGPEPMKNTPPDFKEGVWPRIFSEPVKTKID